MADPLWALDEKMERFSRACYLGMNFAEACDWAGVDPEDARAWFRSRRLLWSLDKHRGQVERASRDPRWEDALARSREGVQARLRGLLVFDLRIAGERLERRGDAAYRITWEPGIRLEEVDRVITWEPVHLEEGEPLERIFEAEGFERQGLRPCPFADDPEFLEMAAESIALILLKAGRLLDAFEAHWRAAEDHWTRHKISELEEGSV